MAKFVKLKLAGSERELWVNRTAIAYIVESDVWKDCSKIGFSGGDWFVVEGKPDKLMMYKIGDD